MTQINGFGANAQEFEYPKLVANIRLELGLRSDIDRHQPYPSQIQELQAQMNGLKAENLDLKTECDSLKRESRWKPVHNVSSHKAELSVW